MTDIYSFTSDDKIHVKGRGDVYYVTGEQIPDELANVRDLRGQNVLINGNLFTCVGVDCNATFNPRGAFGILVRSREKTLAMIADELHEWTKIIGAQMRAKNPPQPRAPDAWEPPDITDLLKADIIAALEDRTDEDLIHTLESVRILRESASENT